MLNKDEYERLLAKNKRIEQENEELARERNRKEDLEDWKMTFALKCTGITFLFVAALGSNKWAWPVFYVAIPVAFFLGLWYADRHPKHFN